MMKEQAQSLSLATPTGSDAYAQKGPILNYIFFC